VELTSQPRLLRSKAFRAGLFLLFLSALMWLGLVITTAHEQALTPGEKSLGVAALGILWGLPLVFFGAAGTCVLLFSFSVFLFRKFTQRSKRFPSDEP